MHRSEREAMAVCARCGDTVAPGVGRTFDFAETGVLCWDCAIERGGEYDAERECWSTPPRLDGLSGDERSH